MKLVVVLGILLLLAVLAEGITNRRVRELELQRQERDLNATLRRYGLNIQRAYQRLKPYIRKGMSLLACTLTCKLYAYVIFFPVGWLAGWGCGPLCSYALSK